MTRTPKIILRDQQRLVGVEPGMVVVVLAILRALDDLNFGMFVTEGVRSDARQIELWNQGRTTPGDIVTEKNGTTNRSRHQVRADGFGYAVDLAFLDDPTTAALETYDDKQPWDLMGLMAEKRGLVWGGRWVTPHDLPHIEKRA